MLLSLQSVLFAPIDNQRTAQPLSPRGFEIIALLLTSSRALDAV
jgi:hypothetical protein